MKTLYFLIIIVSAPLLLIALLQSAHAQNISTENNATLILNFNSSEFDGYQGDSFTLSHDGSMYAYSTAIRDSKSGNWKASLWLYFLKNDTSRSLDLNSDASQISDISFSPDDKKLLFIGNGCDDNTSHTTFFMFNLQDIHLKCNGFTNVHSADWMPDGSVVFLQNNEENDTMSIYQNGTWKLLYTKQITPPYVSLNSSHIEFIKASPDGKKIALWYFVMLSHKTQILDVDDGKIINTFDGGHPRWSHDGNMLLYTNPLSTGYYDKGPRAVITYINLLDINKNKTSTLDSVPVGVDDLFLSENSNKAFYVTKVSPPYEFLNFTSGVYEIDLNNIVNNTTQQHSLPDMDSPLKQFKSGITSQNIICKDDFVLAIKKEGHMPACVNPDTVSKLVLRGWAENPLSELLLSYGNQTQANFVFYDVMNEPKIREWSATGWKYSDYGYGSNGETNQSSATIHLYLPSNIGKHLECENGSYALVVVNLKPVEIEHNYTEVGCNIVTTTGRMDPESNVR